LQAPGGNVPSQSAALIVLMMTIKPTGLFNCQR